MAEWLRRLTRKPKVRTAIGSNPVLDSLVTLRNSSPGRLACVPDHFFKWSGTQARVDQSHVREIW